MKNFIHNFIYIIVPSIVLLICFGVFTLRSNAAEMLLSNALRSALVIGSEYLVARNGQTINNSASENISDGSMGSISVKPDYMSAIADAFSSAIPNVNDLISTARDFDVSNLSQSELAKFNLLVLGDDNLSGSNVIFKQATINGITAYWAVNQAGDWVGNSIKNIAVKFTPKTETLSSNIDSSLATNYNYKNLVFTKSLQVNQQSKVWVFDCDSEVYFYTDSNGILFAVLPAGIYENDYFSDIRIVDQGNIIFNGRATIMGDNTTVFTINNFQYKYGWVSANSNAVISQNLFSSLDDIKSQIAINGYLGDVVYAELKDLATDQGYVVPDVEENVVGISDIYYAIQHLENAINGLDLGQDGTVDGLSAGLTDSQVQDIIDAIERAISGGISIDDSETETDTYDNQGIAIPPSFNNDLFNNTFSVFKLPFNFFSIFEPIFYSFGSFAMMFGLFQFIPFVLIVIVLIWVIK